MGLDHGILNVPLAKRGDIDRQIDRYKRERATQERREHSARLARIKAETIVALAAVRGLSRERLAELGQPHGLTAAQCRRQMEAAARNRPAQVVRALTAEFSRRGIVR